MGIWPVKAVTVIPKVCLLEQIEEENETAAG